MIYLIYQILIYQIINPKGDSMEKDDRLIYLTGRARHQLKEHIRARLQEKGMKISHTQSGILCLLIEEGALSMTKISKAFDVDNSAITSMVDRLEREGFVSREPHPSDRRVNLITITESGIAEVSKAGEIIKETNEKIKEGFSEEEVDVYRRVLQSFFTKFPLNKSR